MIDICNAQPPYRYGVRTLSSQDVGIVPKPSIPIVTVPEEVEKPTEPEIINDEPEKETIVPEIETTADVTNLEDGLSAFSKKSAQALELNGITTVAQLQAYLAEGKTLEELPKIGPKLEQTILEELEKIIK